MFVKRLPLRDPEIKLMPIIKLIGKLTVSLIKKLTFLFKELFWIPTISIKNKAEFNVTIKKIFFNRTDIY